MRSFAFLSVKNLLHAQVTVSGPVYMEPTYPASQVTRHDELKIFVCLYEQGLTRVSSVNAILRR